MHTEFPAGKTTIHGYFLSELLKRDQVVVFYCRESAQTFLFLHDHVWTPSQNFFRLPATKKGFIWALVDTAPQKEPLPAFVAPVCFLVHTPSPDPVAYRWIKQRSHHIWGMPLWEMKELRTAYVFALIVIFIPLKFRSFQRGPSP
jgi:hypothetical protein